MQDHPYLAQTGSGTSLVVQYFHSGVRRGRQSKEDSGWAITEDERVGAEGPASVEACR